MASQNKTNRFISALLIITIILPTVLFPMPKKAEAQWAVFDVPHTVVSTINGIFQGTTTGSTLVSTGLKIKDFAAFLLRQILMRIAKAILAKITQATINWINSGFHGSPLFIENPSSFFKDIAKSQVRTLVDMIGYDTFKFPFGPQTALNVIDSYKRQLAINGQYTLNKVINDPDLLVRYRNDFSYGGWNGFLLNTQYPQNNYIGFQGIVQQNLASQLQGTLQAPAQKVQAALQQGMGFLSPQTCPSNPNYNNGVNEFLKPSFKPPAFVFVPPPSLITAPRNEDGSEDASAEYQAQEYADQQAQEAAYAAQRAQYEIEAELARGEWEELNTCPDGLVSTTPGAVVGNQITNALGSSLRQTELGAALGNSIDAIFDALINKMLDTGLNALKSTINPSAGEDNWSYNGQTLSGSTGYGNTNTVTGILDLGIAQQNVSLTANPTLGGIESTIYDGSKTISGGTAPYGIVSGNAVVSQKTILKTGTSIPIATAQISRNTTGTTITIHGIAKGTGSLVLRDSSVPPKNVTLNVAVNNVGDLVASPANVSINLNETARVAISGGQGNYSIQNTANSNIALVDFAGTNLVITGVARGDTSVVVQDSSTPKKTVSINIAVAAPEELRIVNGQNLPISNISINMSTNPLVTLNITGGTPNYIIDTIVDSNIVDAGINGSVLTIIGKTNGQTAVIITDSATSIKIATLNISITGGAVGEKLGTCVSSNSQRTTKTGCDIVGGTWTEDTSTPTGGGNTGPNPIGKCRMIVGGLATRYGGYAVSEPNMTRINCENALRDSGFTGEWVPPPTP